MILIGLNLRPVMATVGPLLDQIRATIPLSFQAAGLLTTLPMLALGILALCGHALYRIGIKQGITIGLLLIVIGCIARQSWYSSTGLLITALLAGLGIGLVQVLIPGFIKKVAPNHVERLMGLYITAIMGGSTLGALFSASLAQRFSWPGALAAWGLPALLALIAWIWLQRRVTIKEYQVTENIIHPPRFFNQMRAWMLAVFFGLGTSAYTFVLAWLAPFYLQQGWSASSSGILLAAVNATEVLAGLTISIFAHRWLDRRIPLIIAIVLLNIGIICLMMAPNTLAWLAVVLMGMGIGAIFPLSLIVALDHANEPHHAGILAAFVQGVGYILASIMPYVAGILRDALGSFELAWGVMLALMFLMLPIAWCFSPQSVAKALK